MTNTERDDKEAAGGSMMDRLAHKVENPSLSPDMAAKARQLFSISEERMMKNLRWYRNLNTEEREFLNLITLTAIEDYLAWATQPKPVKSREEINADHLFSIAPIETARAISLSNVLEDTRTVVKVISENISLIAPEGKERDYYEAVLYYSREVAFSAASVYAEVAETRSRWMAREEGLVINSLLDHNLDLSLQSRMSIYGWDNGTRFFSVVGRFRSDVHSEIMAGFYQTQAQAAIRKLGVEALMGTHTNSLFMVLVGGNSDDHFHEILDILETLFSREACMCVGPRSYGYEGASHSIRAAYNGYFASAAVMNPSRPIYADDLIAERALFGDVVAFRQLYDVYQSIRDASKNGDLIETLEYYLLEGSSFERTAEAMVIHPNTARYRLRKVTELTGWDPTDPLDAYALRYAVKIGRYEDSLKNQGPLMVPHQSSRSGRSWEENENFTGAISSILQAQSQDSPALDVHIHHPAEASAA